MLKWCSDHLALTLFGTTKNIVGEQKFAPDADVQSAVRQSLGQQTASLFAERIQNLFIDGISVYMNLDDFLKN